MSGLHASGCKELIEVAGCSMLERTIRELEQAGIENIVVVSSPAKPAIDAALEGRGVHIVHQSKPTGLVDAVACARPLIGDGPMLIALPDGLFPDLNPSAALLRTWQGMTTLVTVRTESPWGELLHDTGRVQYVSATDDEALAAFQLCSRLEGIIPALEPAHALAHVAKIAGDLPKDHLMVMNMCGRGDKDVFAVARFLGIEVSQ